MHLYSKYESQNTLRLFFFIQAASHISYARHAQLFLPGLFFLPRSSLSLRSRIS